MKTPRRLSAVAILGSILLLPWSVQGQSKAIANPVLVLQTLGPLSPAAQPIACDGVSLFDFDFNVYSITDTLVGKGTTCLKVFQPDPDNPGWSQAESLWRLSLPGGTVTLSVRGFIGNLTGDIEGWLGAKVTESEIFKGTVISGTGRYTALTGSRMEGAGTFEEVEGISSAHVIYKIAAKKEPKRDNID